MALRDPHLAAARLVQDAGGELVGRTRAQKVAYLAQLAGFGSEFSFEYHNFGPFSDDLARGLEIASALGQLKEDERPTGWGGYYSIYRLRKQAAPADPKRAAFLQRAKAIGAIELELAATAAFIFDVEGIGRTKGGNPWTETARRKPEKAKDGRLAKAAEAYESLRGLAESLPALPTPA
jgi:uncharacterized protein YwgA